jgi:hypothetical protein
LQRLPPPHATAAPAPSPAPRHGYSFSSPPRCSCPAEPRRSGTWPMINAAGCRAKSSSSGGAVVPVQRCHCPRPRVCSPAPPRTLQPTVRWGRQGGVANQRSRGRGCGCGFHGAAAAAIVPGRICQRHCRPDARSHVPGPASVGGMDWQPPVPCRRDKGCCCRPTATGPLLRSWPGGASC